jgi:two-component system, chemotaxis family, sensor kinase Cph1
MPQITSTSVANIDLSPFLLYPQGASMTNPHPAIYSIKRHGTTIQACEDEPIRTPGCIQSHGVLFVLRLNDFTILQVSENCSDFLGLTPAQLLGQKIAAVLRESDHIARLHEMVKNESLECNPVYAFTLRAENQFNYELDATIHTLGDFALLELESTQRNPQLTPDYYSMIKKITPRLQAAPTLESFCTLAASEMRKVTALDRVMIYRFHPDASGEVFAEDHRADLPSWQGLRYPAEDIPKVARDIFKKLTIRPLPNARAELAELIPLANPDTGAPTELTYCALRGASIMYTEYLTNMGVAASLTMPILRDGELWGLVACHHQTPTHFPFQLRAAAEFLAHVVSLEIKAAETREQFDYVRRMEATHIELVAKAAAEGGLAVIVEPAPQLLDGIECTGAAVYHRERWWTVGTVPSVVQLDKLGPWLRDRLLRDIDASHYYATDSLGKEYLPAKEFDAVASGILAIPVSRSCHNLIIWFRPELLQTINWAGNPYDNPTIVGPNGPRLTPRASFELWQETARGRSTPWLNVEIEAALKLRLLVMDLVVTRAEQIAALNMDLAKSNEELNAFAYVASHDLKEPLRGIHKYAWYLMEDAKAGRPLDEVAQQRLASMLRLTVRMDGLLNSLLHFSRLGRLELAYEEVDLSEVVNEAIEMLGSWVEDPTVVIKVDRPLPHLRCDRVRVREIFSNLIGNGLKYNDSNPKSVTIGYVDPSQHANEWYNLPWGDSIRSECVFYVRDNGIGIDVKHHAQIFNLFKRLHSRNAYGGGTGAGLAITRKLVEQHGGHLWVESKLGTGSTFYFTLTELAREIHE